MPLTESPSEGRLVDIGDTRLFVVERSQEGQPVVALHAAGLDHWIFGDYLDGLGPELRVVLPDQRGHGMSDPAESISLEQLAADVGALADALELTGTRSSHTATPRALRSGTQATRPGASRT